MTTINTAPPAKFISRKANILMRYSFIYITIFLIGAVQQTNAQAKKKATDNNADTVLPPRTVVVTSAFKPVLKQTSKINFTGVSPLPDSVRPVLEYDVPAQNLMFGYQSATLRAIADNIDTAIQWHNDNYLKVGFGNYTTPLLQAGLSFGNGTNSAISLNGKYTSSNGPGFMDFSKTDLGGTGIFTTKDQKNEWTANAAFNSSTQYQYGFSPDTLKFNKSDLKQSFTGFTGKVSLRNKMQNAAAVDYNPMVGVNIFTDNHNGRENTLMFDLPITKTVLKILSFNVGLHGNVTHYKSDSGEIDNNLYYISPSIAFKTPNLSFVAGFTPSWDNSTFYWLPNFKADIKVTEEKFVLQGGWIGYFNKTNYQTLADINPWLQQPTFLKNTRIREQYAGFKGSAGSHITYNARISFLKMYDQPLFVNDTSTGKSFQVVNESEINDLRFHAELGYTVAEKFSLLAGVSYNRYSNLSNNDEAYGLLPLEINGSLRWQVVKDWWLKSDVFFWDGSQFRTKQLQSSKLDPALDLNAGVEFKILPQLNGFLQFNNVFNNKYQRWNQYQVLGFNMLGGVVYSFGQK